MKTSYHMLMDQASDGTTGGSASGGGTGSDGNGSSVLSLGGGNNQTPETSSASPGTQSTNQPPTVAIPENWKEAIAQEFKEDPSLKPIHNFQDLVKSYIHAQKTIGMNKATVPDPRTATETDWQMFFQKAGLPAKFEEYTVEVPKNAKFADGFLTQFKETAFKAGILPHQMNKLLGWYHEANEKALSDFLVQDKAQQDKSVGSLKQEWGNDWDRNTKLSNGMLAMAIKEAGISNEDVKSWLDSGAGNDPMLIKLLFGMSKFVKEDVIAGDGAQLPASTQTIKEEINNIMGDKAHAIHDKHHPNHKNAVQHMEGLFQKLHPAKTQMQNTM